MPFAVLTRDPVDAQPYAALLEPLGLEVIAMPVTKPAPAADPDALTRAVSETSYDAILVASPRAAHELARAVAASLTARTTLPDLPEVWAVGPGTKRALDIAKLPAKMPAGPRDGVELARALIASRKIEGKRVLVPRAEEGRMEAMQLLRAAGAHVVDVVAYRTVAVAADDPGIERGLAILRAGTAAVTCVFAPSQVTALGSLLGSLGDLATRFCAIGETTALAARSAGATEVQVASAPTPEGMAEAVRAVYPDKR